jgi:hypothetical protein
MRAPRSDGHRFRQPLAGKVPEQAGRADSAYMLSGLILADANRSQTQRRSAVNKLSRNRCGEVGYRCVNRPSSRVAPRSRLPGSATLRGCKSRAISPVQPV